MKQGLLGNTDFAKLALLPHREIPNDRIFSLQSDSTKGYGIASDFI